MYNAPFLDGSAELNQVAQVHVMPSMTSTCSAWAFQTEVASWSMPKRALPIIQPATAWPPKGRLWNNPEAKYKKRNPNVHRIRGQQGAV